MSVEILTKEDLQEFREEIMETLTKVLNQTATRRWLRSKDVCKMLGISLSCMQNMRNTGALPYTKLEGTYFYEYKEIVAVLDKNKVEATK